MNMTQSCFWLLIFSRVFLCSVTFYWIIKKRNTECFSPVPYIVNLLSQVLWVYYGVIKPKGLLIATISGVGFIFMTIYLAIFITYASKTNRIYTVKLISFSSIAYIALFLGTFFGSRGRTRLTIVGFLCAINSICMFASPLVVMKKVITTRSVEYMPFFLSLSLFVNGGTWFTYSILVMDIFMGVPSGLGFLFGIIQLILYACYYKTTPKNSSGMKTNLEPIKICTKEQDPAMVKLEDLCKHVQIQVP
ncbi:hypothetical protein KP509_32G024800 [Ceratopteris richardii]|uniref:Bidirectional sugar transporter SWEET n=1 Tax=Ceratopteris richardii TaxID=49495 RepID=A0A8T2QRQ5_CERRI|nr:hypothetical protein KP509_32G024800 [Ceratopteris richardii]